jgi:hypothetical protein
MAWAINDSPIAAHQGCCELLTCGLLLYSVTDKLLAVKFGRKVDNG